MNKENTILSVRPLGFQWFTKDPFLFCAHHNDHYPKGNGKMGPLASLAGRNMGSDFDERNKWRMYHGLDVPGFPVHPHRGFETVTIALKGFIDHSDSAGCAGRYGNGDVQWMTAGEGVQHSEMFPLLSTEEDNPLELFQVWLNLPRAKKMVKPYFKMLWKDTIPNIPVTDEGGKTSNVILISGNAHGKTVESPSPDSWASGIDNEVLIMRVTTPLGARYKLAPSKKGVNRMLYYYQGGDATINGVKIESGNAVELDPVGELEFVNGDKESEFLVLQGKPINEPVVQYGPFVMNTTEEIQATIADYRRTSFGGWPWPQEEQVHGTRSRFARYADKTEDIPQ